MRPRLSRALLAARKAFMQRPMVAQLAAAGEQQQLYAQQHLAAAASFTVEESLWRIERALAAGELEATRGARYLRAEIEELARREAEAALSDEEAHLDERAPEFSVSAL